MRHAPYPSHFRRPARNAPRPAALAEDLDASQDALRNTPAYAHLEAGDEAIWFAVACVLASLMLYVGVVLSHVAP